MEERQRNRDEEKEKRRSMKNVEGLNSPLVMHVPQARPEIPVRPESPVSFHPRTSRSGYLVLRLPFSPPVFPVFLIFPDATGL